MKRAAIILGFIALLLIVFFKRPSGGSTSHLHGTAMGSQWNLKWRGDAPPPRELRREVSATLEKWEQILSHWRPDSDLSRHNLGAPASPELRQVIALADAAKAETGGVFDHHLLERTHAAGFGPAGRGIDLSAIGKGFAVDRVGETLRGLGVTDFIFELGGDVLAGDGEWEVGLEVPDPATRNVGSTIRLNRQALATSGNYRQFLSDREGLASHLIDPGTGKPVIRPASSVSVIAADCATADAWATALFILGPDHEPPDLKVIWLER